MWLSKRQILVWLKHKTSNLTGGTINIAANVVNCNWPVTGLSTGFEVAGNNLKVAGE